MNRKLESLALALATMLVTHAAAAQDNVFKLGLTEYTTHARTNGISGIGVPAGADADTGNAATVIFTYERMVTPHIGAEFVIGVPPKIEASATGTVAFLGDDVLEAHFVAPTFFVNYHFGQPGDTWRPYLGAGVNYTKFIRVESILASDVQMSSSTGGAVQAGIDYALDQRWSLFASVAALRVKSKLVATGSTVLQTTIDFRPITYSFGAAWRF